MTSTPEWAKVQNTGKEHFGNTALETATTTSAYCWSFAWSSILSSRTPSSNKRKSEDKLDASSENRKYVLHTRVMPSAGCHTDHRLVHKNSGFASNPNQRKESPLPEQEAFKINNFESAEYRPGMKMQVAPERSLQSRLEDVSCLTDLSEKVFGFTTARKKDWFCANNQKI